MIMNELIQHIRHLLFTSGSVAVEGVGMFMQVSHSASFSGNSTLDSPYPTTVFEAHDVVGSDDLVRSYARRHGYDAGEARQAVKSALALLRQTLSDGETVLIPDVGSLSLDSGNGQLQFEAMPSHWLEPLDVSPLEKETKVAAEEPDYEAMWIAERRRNMLRAIRRAASGAAAIAVIVLLAFVVSHMPERVSVMPQVAGIGMGQSARSQEDTQTESSAASEAALVLVLNTPADGCGPAKIRYRDTKSSEEPGRYCLVVASLASTAEAEKFIAGHSTTDMPLRLLEKDGRWRVYALSAPSIEELTVAGRNLGVYEAYPSAWICRR